MGNAQLLDLARRMETPVRNIVDYEDGRVIPYSETGNIEIEETVEASDEKQRMFDYGAFVPVAMSVYPIEGGPKIRYSYLYNRRFRLIDRMKERALAPMEIVRAARPVGIVRRPLKKRAPRN